MKMFNGPHGQSVIQLIVLVSAIGTGLNIVLQCQIIVWEIIYTMKNAIPVKNVPMRKVLFVQTTIWEVGPIGLNGPSVQLCVEVEIENGQENVIRIMMLKKVA